MQNGRFRIGKFGTITQLMPKIKQKMKVSYIWTMPLNVSFSHPAILVHIWRIFQIFIMITFSIFSQIIIFINQIPTIFCFCLCRYLYPDIWCFIIHFYNHEREVCLSVALKQPNLVHTSIFKALQKILFCGIFYIEWKYRNEKRTFKQGKKMKNCRMCFC